MPSLNWIGKEAVSNHDKEVPFKLLKKVKTASVGDNSQNLIVHGDNLEVLKALMPYYYGKIKCIYIDPPYNTGNEGWVYNDRVNSPKIKQWLKKTVKLDDLTRHDKWLCMMYPRLKLLRDLLSEDGVIFISIDDNEHCNLRLILDEIFGEKNFLANISIQSNPRGRQSERFFATVHEFLLSFSKNIDLLSLKGKDLSVEQIKEYKYKDELGAYRLLGLRQRGAESLREDRPNMFFPIYVNVKGQISLIQKKGFVEVLPKKSNGEEGRWMWSLDKVNRSLDLLVARLISKRNEWDIFVKDYLFRSEGKGRIVKSKTIWIDKNINYQIGKQELGNLFGKKIFDYPKPVSLLSEVFGIVGNKEAVYLDSFAGSGTTGHAVLDLNKKDGGSRKFIMVEMEDAVAKDITADRVKRAIKKYDFKDGFEYCELDKPLFNEHGQVEETCDFRQFATYIYFTETQTNIDLKKIKANYIGELGTTEYYLIYKEKNKNDLDKTFLKNIQKTDNKKIIYADRCLIDDDTLARHNIVFKQIPYEVKVY